MTDWYWCAVVQGWRTVACDIHYGYGCGVAPTPPPIVPFPVENIWVGDESLLNETELAEWLHISVSTVRNWRYSDDGPPVSKVGRSVRYAVADVEKWVISNA